ncbi:hypothetical protein HELRODRAFT_124908, partial [Helobdella robusta]|uniref:RRM domain-containing protein n=1 Tax=Helobdella robusta TaxID=6412 RepID=T1EH35_HELRO
WLPVSYVRDMVLPLNERILKDKLWHKVINKLKKYESKLVFKVDTVKGEDYEVMKWQTNSSALNHHMNGGGSRGHLKTWQGPAVSNSEKPIQKLYPPLTNCLKVRNMFNFEVEIGEDWKRVVRDAILEKVGPGHGIVSLVVDNKSKEGCVYIRCVDEKKAGEAFDSLHCWWFDNQLVTVKYLRLQRFLERFPDDANNTKPLQPSNEARLSLSLPY